MNNKNSIIVGIIVISCIISLVLKSVIIAVVLLGLSYVGTRIPHFILALGKNKPCSPTRGFSHSFAVPIVCVVFGLFEILYEDSTAVGTGIALVIVGLAFGCIYHITLDAKTKR